MASAKRRFGVSMSEDLARRLDELSLIMGVNRSKLVEDAVRNIIDDYMHMTRRHVCAGLLVINCSSRVIDDLVEKYKRVTDARLHIHVAGSCYELLVVNGDSLELLSMAADLRNRNCRVKYIPLAENH